jgi:hypothetical protein
METAHKSDTKDSKYILKMLVVSLLVYHVNVRTFLIQMFAGQWRIPKHKFLLQVSNFNLVFFLFTKGGCYVHLLRSVPGLLYRVVYIYRHIEILYSGCWRIK